MISLIVILSLARSIEIPLIATHSCLSRPFNKLLKLASAPINNSYNLQYSAALNLGTPAQELTFVLDTGSSYTWAPSTQCNCHVFSHSFNKTESSTFYDMKEDIRLEYGKGVVQGNLSLDSLNLGNLTAVNQTFVLSYYDEDLEGLESDGLLGLAFNELSDGHKTFIENLKVQGQLPEAVFAFSIGDINKENSSSVFSIGEYDFQKYGKGEVKELTVIQTMGFWTTSIEEFKLGDKEFKMKKGLSIIDLGSSLISVPEDIYEKYSEEVLKTTKDCQDIGLLACKCQFGNYSKFQSLKFKMNGVDIVIDKENIIYYEDNYCYLLIDSMPYEDFWIMGQPFFRQYYTVFNMDRKVISISNTVEYPDDQAFPDSFILIFLIIFGALVVVLLIVGCLYFKCKNNKGQKKVQFYESEPPAGYKAIDNYRYSYQGVGISKHQPEENSYTNYGTRNS